MVLCVVSFIRDDGTLKVSIMVLSSVQADPMMEEAEDSVIWMNLADMQMCYSANV